LIPVQEKALSGSATCVAPRFRRNSDTSTQATLKPSCSHGLRKPEGRPRIRFSSLSRFHRNRFCTSRFGRARHSVRAARSARRGLLALPTSKLMRVWKFSQNRIMPRRSEIFDYATKCRIQHSAGMPHIEVEWHQFAIQMQLRLVV